MAPPPRRPPPHVGGELSPPAPWTGAFRFCGRCFYSTASRTQKCTASCPLPMILLLQESPGQDLTLHPSLQLTQPLMVPTTHRQHTPVLPPWMQRVHRASKAASSRSAFRSAGRIRGESPVFFSRRIPMSRPLYGSVEGMSSSCQGGASSPRPRGGEGEMELGFRAGPRSSPRFWPQGWQPDWVLASKSLPVRSGGPWTALLDDWYLVTDRLF